MNYVLGTKDIEVNRDKVPAGTLGLKQTPPTKGALGSLSAICTPRQKSPLRKPNLQAVTLLHVFTAGPFALQSA
jgi:hypothetical protein